jgi:hypothetical protein
VTSCSSTMASTRVRAWAAPTLRWWSRPGAAASKRIHELRRRLRGSGTTRPTAWRMRRIVETDGADRQVPGDGGRAGVEALGRELHPQRHDAVAHRARRRLRARMGPPGARPEVVEPALPVPPEQAVQVPAADAALRGRGGDGRLCGDDLEDSHPMLRHGRDCPMSRLTCRLSGVTYVVDSDTSGRATPTCGRACGRPLEQASGVRRARRSTGPRRRRGHRSRPQGRPWLPGRLGSGPSSDEARRPWKPTSMRTRRSMR